MIGCVRTGKTAAYLSRFGHEVRVVTAREQGLPFRSLPVELPQGAVTTTEWVGPRRILDKLTTTDLSPSRNSVGLRAKLVRLLRGVAYLPDPQVGWIPYAYAAGSRLIRESRPDVILASSGPPSSLIVASLLSKRFGIPWIGDLRDLWSGNQNYPFPRWRRPVDRQIERRVLSSAAGLVTVSEPLARSLSAFGPPVSLVLNGYDEAEYGHTQRTRPPSTNLRIVYTGTLYPKQSPAPLFEAVSRLGALKGRVKLVFIGPPEAQVRATRHAEKIVEQIEVQSMGPRPIALAAQVDADVLLHLLFNDPEHTGVYGAKIFEYLRARRPVLAVGDTRNVTAQLVNERGAGVATSDPAVIENQIRDWLRQLEQNREIPPLPESVSAGFSREEQTRRLETFMTQVLSR